MNILTHWWRHETPTSIHYGLWYAFLCLWMQGEALLNIFWVLLLLASIPYLSYGLQVLRHYRWLSYSIIAYITIRIISISYALDSHLALLGITDDLRIFSIGLIAVSLMRTKVQIQKSLIFTFIGFAFLGWHAVEIQWNLMHNFTIPPNANVEFGSLAHMNYAAAFSSVIMFSGIVAWFYAPNYKWKASLLLLILPLAIMQLPLTSRTTLVIGGLILAIYLLYKLPIIKAMLIGGVIASIAIVTLAQVRGGVEQFHGVSQPVEDASVWIRIDIWKTLHRIVEDHPLGVGPKNLIAIDLNPYKDWMLENIHRTISYFYPSHAIAEGLKNTDMNTPQHLVTDPHSHYAAIYAENGPIGLLIFLSWLGALLILAARSLRHANLDIRPYAEACAGGLLILSGCAIMTALFYQSGGIITMLLAAFLISQIHAAENALENNEANP